MKIGLSVLVDSSDEENYKVAGETVFPFLGHFGIPYRTYDLAGGRDPEFDASGVLVAQEGLGGKLPRRTKDALYRAMRDGVGLINMDHRVDTWEELRDALGVEETGDAGRTSSVRLGRSHYVVRLQEPEPEKGLLREVEFFKVKGGEPLLLSDDGSPLLSASSSPRLVQFLVSPRIWLQENFGHCFGLDDVLFRAILWAVRKPFVAKRVPPFVTCRIDDASGTASMFGRREDSANRGFAYLDLLNEYGYIPNVGLFIDDITDEDGRVIKGKYDEGKAQFSPHAFSDPENVNEHPIYMLHDGREFSTAQLKENFARVDERFGRWGIRLAETVNAHFAEIGVNSLPFLRERGVRFTMQPGVPFGCTWEGASQGRCPRWDPKPYGNHGFNYDFMPDHPEFFNAVAHPLGSHKLRGSIAPTDFLWGNTVFWKESEFNDIRGAAEKGARVIRLGLDGGFFGCLMTHEQRIATLSLGEFEEVLRRIEGLLSDRERFFAPYDEVAEYLYNHGRTKLVGARLEGGRMICRLRGKSEVPLKVSVFREEGEDVAEEFFEVPQFCGEVEHILTEGSG